MGGLFALSVTEIFHVGAPLALVGATLGGFVLGVIFELVILRPSERAGESGVTIATVATIFLLLYGHALVPAWGSLPQPLAPFSGDVASSITIAGTSVQVQSLWVFALLALALGAMYVFFERTYYGKAVRAVADNPLGARLVGIPVGSTRAFSVGLGIALAAYGGTIIGPITLVGGAAGTAIAIKGFVSAVVGGLESPAGCVAGGLFVGVAEKLLEIIFPNGVADPAVYAMLLVAMLVRPNGLFGRARAVRD